MKFNRIIVIVTDSVAPAELPMPNASAIKGPIPTATSTQTFP